MVDVKLSLYADPGHAWLRVPKKLVAELGIAEKITRYSYMRGDYAYLEEDVDLTTFVEAMMENHSEIQRACRGQEQPH